MLSARTLGIPGEVNSTRNTDHSSGKARKNVVMQESDDQLQRTGNIVADALYHRNCALDP